MKKSKNKKQRMKTIANYERYKMKQNSDCYKRNERNKHEHCQSSETNDV